VDPNHLKRSATSVTDFETPIFRSRQFPPAGGESASRDARSYLTNATVRSCAISVSSLNSVTVLAHYGKLPCSLQDLPAVALMPGPFNPSTINRLLDPGPTDVFALSLLRVDHSQGRLPFCLWYQVTFRVFAAWYNSSLPLSHINTFQGSIGGARKSTTESLDRQ
jgi:hypothetical protein